MKFESNPIEEHGEAPLADDGRLEAAVLEWTRRAQRAAPHLTAEDGKNSCFVACLGVWDSDAVKSAQLGEILALVQAQGDRVVGHATYRLSQPNPRTFIGRGTYENLVEQATECGADLLVLDAELSPSQTRNLEEATGLAVCDREAVILNVFLRHARTRRARIQVEIAHLEYLRPRIRGVGLVMDQQAGGVMGGRGPGETQSELMSRQIDGRLAELRREFERISRSSRTQRQGRSQSKRIVLVGYTNAGKTTLMNALTEAGLSAKDMPFETLDTTSRSLSRYGGDVLLSDTVGFIRRLPERLFASFESTLAEAREASLLALVVDVSDPEWRFHLTTTHALLDKLGAGDVARLYVFNKLDRVPATPSSEELQDLCGPHEFALVSGHDADGMQRLKEKLLQSVRKDQRRVRLFVPYAATSALTTIYGRCRVLSAEPEELGMRFELEGDPLVVAAVMHSLEDEQS
ncbi:MAG TPA: GTPase HflX [Polyangiaceae bacterium]|nr:GTPase HflX [Polyangiaceae bacterium]